jgi:hypothetical protein
VKSSSAYPTDWSSDTNTNTMTFIPWFEKITGGLGWGQVPPWRPIPMHPAPAFRTGQESYLSKGGPLSGVVGLACSQTCSWKQMMEKETEYGVPLLRKRVPVGTWMKVRIIKEDYKDLYKWLDQRK